jgi:hypothetical protein
MDTEYAFGFRSQLALEKMLFMLQGPPAGGGLGLP